MAVFAGTFVACLISFLAVFAFALLNEVARDLEDPFGHAVRTHARSLGASCVLLGVFNAQPFDAPCRLQPNQLPIEDLHIDFNERLWSLTQRIFQKDGWYQQDQTVEGAAFAYPRSETDIHRDPGLRGKGAQPSPKNVMGKMKHK